MKERKVPCEIWSRVVGYFRPTNQWNKGKQAEFNDRAEFDPKDILSSIKEDKCDNS